jgi:hypothetical protein
MLYIIVYTYSMKIQINLNRSLKTLYAIHIDIHCYRIKVYGSGIKEYDFIVSLQPTGDTGVLPTYQLFNKDQNITLPISNIFPQLSKWILSEESTGKILV